MLKKYMCVTSVSDVDLCGVLQLVRCVWYTSTSSVVCQVVCQGVVVWYGYNSSGVKQVEEVRTYIRGIED